MGVEPTAQCFAGNLPGRRAASLLECPRQESNLVCDLRRVACAPLHFEDKQRKGRELNPQGLRSAGFQPDPVARRVALPANTIAVRRVGIEPTLPGSRTRWITTFLPPELVTVRVVRAFDTKDFPGLCLRPLGHNRSRDWRESNPRSGALPASSALSPCQGAPGVTHHARGGVLFSTIRVSQTTTITKATNQGSGCHNIS